jgi:class 3 adenylate cyclase
VTDGIEPSEGAEDTRAPASDPPTQPHREVTQRVADADRDRTVTSLREHVVVGRLTLDEFSERVDNALVARTQGDLDALVADLPARAVPEPEATRRRARRRVIAVMGGARAKGRWRASGHTTAIAVMGGCQLDLRQAEIEGSEVVISAFSIMGGIEIKSAPNRHGRGLPSHLDGTSLDAGTGSPVLSEGPAGRTPPDRAPETMSGEPHPEEAPSLAGDRTVTILFIDMVDYSGITERLGDRLAHALVTEHHRIVRSLLTGHGGREVKAQGDGFMVAFGGAARALRCAAAMQRSFREHTLVHPDQPIRVHIGLHTGEATETDDDFFGHTVIVASRIADMAGPDEILVSSLSEQLVAGTGEFHFGEQREVVLKGMSRFQRVAPLIWAN